MSEQKEHVLLKELPLLKDEAPPIPEGFHNSWVQLVKEDASMTENTQPRKPGRFPAWRKLAATAAALVFVIGGTVLTRDQLSGAAGMPQDATYGSITNDEAGYNDAGYGTMAQPKSSSPNYSNGASTRSAAYSMESQSADTAGVAVQESKIIRTASLTIVTKDYGSSLAQLKQLCSDVQGWVSWSSESTASTGLRSASLTMRIPAAQLDSFLEGTGGTGRITYRSETADDVTDSYYDTAARLDTQKALMERLQALVTDAASLSDLLDLEAQLADTQYQIDRLTSSLQSTDRQVDYATVDITLREESIADDLTNPEMSFSQRLWSALTTGCGAFMDFVGDAAVFLVAALPFIGVVVVVVIGCCLYGKKRRKKD